MSDERGQVVLLAAVVVVVASLSMLLAAGQLDYGPSWSPTDSAGPDVASARGVLQDAVDRGVRSAAGRFNWGSRAAAAVVIRQAVRPASDRVERLGVAADATYRVDPNAPGARRVAADSCPRGEDRAFGPCAAHGNIVFQERADEAVVLAVVVDLHVVTPDRDLTYMLVVRPTIR